MTGLFQDVTKVARLRRRFIGREKSRVIIRVINENIHVCDISLFDIKSEQI